MVMCGSAGRSAYEAPGVPASCSVKKHAALPRSAHDPPPKDTTASTPSRRACCTAFCTSGTGTCDVTSANVEASALPSAARTRAPSSLASRPSVVTNKARRAPSVRSSPVTSCTRPAPKTSCCASPVCVHRGAITSPSQEVGLRDPGSLTAADEPLGAETVGEGFRWHLEEERLLADLARMGLHGAPLVFEEIGHVHSRGD